MNERIKELAEQANARELGWAYYRGEKRPENAVDLHSVDLELFAELIIKEYEKLLPEICPWDQADKEGPMKGWHVQFVARKHFGIKE